ncbi:hypothetical protein CNB02780 [Cryptococcus deneoformans JEC21]|uniref:Uncharacterized protein n=1 Tax=Cryptococcus deneoformans (strain JEC21 / ATCC MYA-565) TaxID=214684 RepID=Q5KM65_CRYD1|nr:hypothetical protein CNB02780 [Cryptococcus neoformans var. neoformans JEC21]AAW41709.2 hypothetical protein CNB02780 [Cryptococcus neoformans var. neoformans JEC21]
MSSIPDLSTGSYIPHHWRTAPGSSTGTTSVPTISSLLADKFKHARNSTLDSLGGARNWLANTMSNLGDSIKVPSPPAEPVYGRNVSFPSYLTSDDSTTTTNSSLGTQIATETPTPSSVTTPSVEPTNAVSSSASSRRMPANAIESTNGASSCNVTRTPEGCTSFDIDIRQINLEEGVAIISTGDDGPAHSVIITRDINNVINIDVNRLTADQTTSNSSTAPTAPRGILRRPHLLDIASKSSLSYSGPLLVSGGPPTPGDDGQRVFQDVSVHDYCTSTNGLSGLDKPLTAFENISSFIQRRYRQDDGSLIFSRTEANELAPYLLQSGNDGTEESRALIGFGLDDLIINSVLPSKYESEGDTSRSRTVLVDDTEVPTTTEAGSGVDVSAWKGHSLNEWLSERVASTDTFGLQSDISSLSDGKELLNDVRSLGSQMCRRHGIDSDPDLTTYFSTRIGTYMTDRMLSSGTREVTPGILADADHILFKAISALSGMSEDARISTLLGRNAPTYSRHTSQSAASRTPSTESVTSQYPDHSLYSDSSWWAPSSPTSQSSSYVESPLTSSTSFSDVPSSTSRSVRFNPYVEAVHYE